MIRRLLLPVGALLVTIALGFWGVRTVIAGGTTPGSGGPGGLGVLVDTRTGDELARPLTIRGIPLVNAQHPVSADLQPRVVRPAMLTSEASAAFARLRAAAKARGLTIVWRCGYRSFATQAQVLAQAIEAYGSRTKARRYTAKPGHSEHQLGLAVDVAAPNARGLAFAETPEFRWLRKNAHRYGFVLRYPKGKTAITGIGFEPWHYRYIGVEAAADFGANSTLTLEEYLGGR